MIGTYVPVEMVPVLDEVAAARGMTRSGLIREALDHLVAAHAAKEEAA